MIKLDVKRYCHKCPYFEAETIEHHSSDKVIRCKNWTQCDYAVSTCMNHIFDREKEDK